MRRFQTDQIIKDLDKKMVFITGARQVGKTWLAKEVGKSFKNTVYLNYDSFDDREIIKTLSWSRDCNLLILDELHKMDNWKNYLKGVYDIKNDDLRILVTGSARLDTYRQTGDSLAGRFYTHRLLPFSLSELRQAGETPDIDLLIGRGGLPEPLLSESGTDAKRWRNQYIDGLIRDDLPDFSNVSKIKSIRTVLEILRRNVGSPVSYASISRDVQISPTTVVKYIYILESLYIIFKVTPYTKNIARSILKEPKIYFYDTGLVIGDEGKLLENHTAVSLLKESFLSSDIFGEDSALHYLRTKEGKEADF